jgi:hypothetical protein
MQSSKSYFTYLMFIYQFTYLFRPNASNIPIIHFRTLVSSNVHIQLKITYKKMNINYLYNLGEININSLTRVTLTPKRMFYIVLEGDNLI